MKPFVLIVATALFAAVAEAGRDPTECEVCIKVLSDLHSQLTAEDRKDLHKIEDKIGKFCAKPPSEKENKLVSHTQRPRVFCTRCAPTCVAIAVLLHRSYQA